MSARLTQAAVLEPAPAAFERAPDWSQLTKSPEKQRLYRDDLEVRDALADFRAAFGADAESVLRGLAMLMFKPEAVKRGCLGAVLDFLAERELVPIASRLVDLDRGRCLALWRYQWNKATIDRVRLHVLTAAQVPWLAVVVRDAAQGDGVPPAVRLWGLKGPTDPARRHAGHLRTVLGMTNRMLGFVHTSDEPADVLREHGVLLDEHERAAWLRELGSSLEADRGADVRRAAAALEARTERHSVDLAEVAERLRGGPRGELGAAALAGERHALADVVAAFGEPRTDAERWDLITLASGLIEHDLPGVSAVLDPGALEVIQDRWANGGDAA
jgi:nucleoside diphosphate kinase